MLNNNNTLEKKKKPSVFVYGWFLGEVEAKSEFWDRLVHSLAKQCSVPAESQSAKLVCLDLFIVIFSKTLKNSLSKH